LISGIGSGGGNNTRTDEYGGSIEKRTRFLFDVLDEIRKAAPECRVGVHLNPSAHGLFGMTIDEATIPAFDHLDEGMADQVAFGKLYISNPDLAERFAAKVPTAPWDETTFYTAGPKGYTDYPAAAGTVDLKLLNHKIPK